MLIDFDQSTMANMTAALDSVCKHIPPGKDSSELRKKIANAMIEEARAGRKNFEGFRSAGLAVVTDLWSTGRPKAVGLFARVRRFFRT